MNNEMTLEQRIQLIEKLRAEYEELNGKMARLNAFLCDINFIKKVPDIIEQELMVMQFKSMRGYLNNLRSRIMFQESKLKKEENARKVADERKEMKGHIIPVNLDNTHHCGQDAASQAEDGPAESPESLKDLLGMEVVCVGEMPCDGCPHDHYGAPCVKLELVGGYHICLAAHPNSIITE